MTNLEILNKLKVEKEKMLNDGTFLMKTRMTEQGDSITWRSLAEIDEQIDLYEQKVSEDTTSSKRIGRIKFYG